MTLEIRPERAEDFEAIRHVVASAFTGAEHSAPSVEADGAPGEATLVGWLRASSAYDPRFALVACDDDVVVGHVMATWGDVDGAPVLGIGPIAVEPQRQGGGIGAALMERLLDAVREARQSVVVLLGDPGYYARFGFVPASRVGIVAEPEWGDYFQACVLGVGDAEAVVAEYDGPRGRYTYAEPFARLG